MEQEEYKNVLKDHLESKIKTKEEVSDKILVESFLEEAKHTTDPKYALAQDYLTVSGKGSPDKPLRRQFEKKIKAHNKKENAKKENTKKESIENFLDESDCDSEKKGPGYRSSGIIAKDIHTAQSGKGSIGRQYRKKVKAWRKKKKSGIVEAEHKTNPKKALAKDYLLATGRGRERAKLGTAYSALKASGKSSGEIKDRMKKARNDDTLGRIRTFDRKSNPQIADKMIDYANKDKK